MSREKMTIDEARAHAGKIDLGRAEDRAWEIMPAYIWTEKGEKGKKLGFCTACQTQVMIDPKNKLPGFAANDPYVDDEEYLEHPERERGFLAPRQHINRYDMSGQHKHFGSCPCCGALAMYRSRWMGRKSVVDRIWMIQYRPSAIENGALVMLGFLCVADWGEWDDCNEPRPAMDITLREICVFRPGKGGDRFVAVPYWMGDTETQEDGTVRAVNLRSCLCWERRKKCVSGFDPWRPLFGGEGTRYYLDEVSVDSAIAGSAWEGTYVKLMPELDGVYCLDLIDVFRAISQYPALEYLCKLGFPHLARLAIEKQDEGLINLRGKTAQKVLGVSGDEWGWIKGHKEHCTLGLLKALDKKRRLGLQISTELIGQALRMGTSFDLIRLMNEAEKSRAAQAVKWCIRHKVSFGNYVDYLYQLQKLKITDKNVLYPADFAEAHARLSERIRWEENKGNDKHIKKRLEELGEYWFSALGLTLRPMVSSGEIIREGEMMQHCVGGYVKRYAEGGTILLCLREDERPLTPYRTVEFSRDGKMVQCRGKRNQSPEDEQERIDQFWALFEMYRKDYARQHRKKRKRRAA